jgi:hypothetical protein
MNEFGSMLMAIMSPTVDSFDRKDCDFRQSWAVKVRVQKAEKVHRVIWHFVTYSTLLGMNRLVLSGQFREEDLNASDEDR